MEYNTLASDESIGRAIDALASRGIKAFVLDDRQEALQRIRALIPKGASVMNGSSRTLEEIGYIEYLKGGKHGWNNIKEEILKEKDPEKQQVLRRQSVLSDYYLGSVHAAAETGELVIASNSGSQLPHVVFTSPHIIFIVGTQKIVPTLDAGIKRVREYVYPLEDQRMKSEGALGSNISKLLIFEKEPEFLKRKVILLFVKEKLGF